MGVQRLIVRQRERALASDQRAGRWARGKARRLQREYVRRNWRILSGVGGGLLLLIAAAVPLFPSPFARGLYLGSFSTAVAGLLAFMVVQATGTAPTMMGDEAERWTAQELRKLRGRGWKLINHISLKGWNIDHVLVGPGGAFAIETKWTATSWQGADRDPRVGKACVQVAGNAHTLSLWLRKVGLGSVEPVLILWGSGSREQLPTQVVQSGGRDVTVVAGPHFREWMEALGSDRLDADQVQRAWAALEGYCARRDPREDEEAPIPLSIVELATRGFLVVLSASAAFLSAATWLSRQPSATWWLPALLMLLAPGIGLLRLAASARYIAWGWLCGVGISALFILCVLAKWALERLA
jgi:hypothetical protein